MTKPDKPTPAELLAQARALNEALANYAPEVLIAEGVRIIEEPAFQVAIAQLETISKALPETEKLKGVFLNIGQGGRAALALVAHKKVMAEAAAAQSGQAAGG